MNSQTLTYFALLRHSGLERSDALALFHHASGKTRAWLIAHDGDSADQQLAVYFEALAARRRTGEPVAYIIGRREFYGREFQVSPAVLIPRPDTELLVELALAHAAQGARVVDLGTGSGCIPVTLKRERPDLCMSAVDISPAALAVAQANAAELGTDVRFIESDWLVALADETFDLIVSNPPYIEQHDPHLQQGDLRFEPRLALTDEADGLAHLRKIVDAATGQLSPGGWLLFEHGWDQGLRSRDLLLVAGFSQVQSWCDLGGHERVSGGRWQ